MDKSLTWWIAIALGLALWSCKSDPGRHSDSFTLDGRYELTHASIDGADSDRLRDLYYVFLPDSSMQTNIMGSEQNFKYTHEGTNLRQHSDPEVDYSIQRDTDSTLTLTTEIRGSHFIIHLGRSKPKVKSPSL